MGAQKFLKKNLLFTVMAAFVFMVTVSVYLSDLIPEEPPVLALFSQKDFPPAPILKETSTSFPVLSALGVLAIDVDSQVPLFEKNADSRLLPASTTKIMTALVSLEHYNLNDELAVGRVNVEGQKMGLVVGEVIKFEDLLYGLLIYSANDAAEVLAQNYPGGREAFIKDMNEKALSLHLSQTHFINPSGLDGGEHFSSARDLVTLSESAMKNGIFAKVVSTRSFEAKSVDGKIRHRLTNINELIGKVDGVLGVKTGWTENARENLVTYIERDNKKVMIALMGSQDRFGETEELINWIFQNYEWQKVGPQTAVNYSP